MSEIVSEVDVSLVIPVYNEVENLRELLVEITDAFAPTDYSYEVLFIDDGSTDGSFPLVETLAEEDEHVVGIRFRRNYGQTAAFAAGFDLAKGAAVVTLDADRQNDPADIPALVNELNNTDVDVVNGWRKDRQDGYLLRLLPSKIANTMIARSTKVNLKDRGCSMRAFRREVVQDLNLYGELHRFIPELVSNAGFTMSEVAVNHRARVAGESKYGLSRTFRVLVDLITILFLRNYGDRPMHFFGRLGFGSGILGVLISTFLAGQKVWAGLFGGWDAFRAVRLSNRPLLLLGILLVFIAVQFFAMGILAELLTRIYYESQRKSVYQVKEIIGR